MSKFDQVVFQDRVKLLMGKRGYTQQGLADKIGCKRQTLNHWLTGSSKPAADMLSSLAEALDCSADYLLNHTTSQTPECALAMDELDLSELAVSVIHGESPHKRAFLCGCAELHSDELEKTLANLSTRQPGIHKTIATLIEHKNFEEAMLLLQRACEFETTAGQSRMLKSLVDGILAGDDSVTLLPDGKYAVSKREAARAMKATVIDYLSKAVSAIIEQNAAPAEEPRR